ncbi:hypothetical protein B0H34DRAFT_130897 [Crassisporium funariophilum]|nr:hypothetical protein B0H34DRAFT_130897 [Crassisporium funariophilum]
MESSATPTLDQWTESLFPQAYHDNDWIASKSADVGVDTVNSNNSGQNDNPFSSETALKDSFGVLLPAYMRKKSADLSNGPSSLDPNPSPPSPSGYSSPPMLSCPPSWLGSEPLAESDSEAHIFEEFPPTDVPLSSSPLPFTSSSPQSDISSEVEEDSSSLTSATSDSRSETESISASQNDHASSESINCHSRSDEFGHRLHELLLVALQERERERATVNHEIPELFSCSDSESSDSASACLDNSHESGMQSPQNRRAKTLSIREGSSSPKLISRWFSRQIPKDSGAARASSRLAQYSSGSDSPARGLKTNHVDQGECAYINSHFHSEAILERETSQQQLPVFQQQNKSLESDSVSPILFEGQESARESAAKSTTGPPINGYRVLKRPLSFTTNDQETLEAMKKRKKTQLVEPTTNRRNRTFAARSASLRRADSLKSFTGVEAETPTQNGCVPTAPVTPVPPHSQRRVNEDSAGFSALPNPVPVIAPPDGHIARLPLTAETLAKVRLGKFLEREGRGREIDCLPVGVCNGPPHWMLDEDSEEPDECDVDDITDYDAVDWERVLGLPRSTREEIVNWILDVLPEKASRHGGTPPSSSTGSHSSRTTSATSTSSIPEWHPSSNLLDQLQNSPQTRFHAAWMFLRYFYLTISPDTYANSSFLVRSRRRSSLDSNISDSSHASDVVRRMDIEGSHLVAWDVAVGCLALSVKVSLRQFLIIFFMSLDCDSIGQFHRDFLHPLLPVYAYEFILLASHRIDHEALEASQRDILCVFDYSLGVTPQPVMDELWLALGSLRDLLHFEGGWQKAMEDAWWGLFDAVCGNNFIT